MIGLDLDSDVRGGGMRIIRHCCGARGADGEPAGTVQATMATTFDLLSADDSHTHIRITGPLDIAGATHLSLKFTAATASRRQHVIVDMSGVDFVASIGLGMLVQVARALMPDGKRVVLLRPNSLVAGVVRTAKLDAVLPIADSPETAMALIA